MPENPKRSSSIASHPACLKPNPLRSGPTWRLLNLSASLGPSSREGNRERLMLADRQSRQALSTIGAARRALKRSDDRRGEKAAPAARAGISRGRRARRRRSGAGASVWESSPMSLRSVAVRRALRSSGSAASVAGGSSRRRDQAIAQRPPALGHAQHLDAPIVVRPRARAMRPRDSSLSTIPVTFEASQASASASVLIGSGRSRLRSASPCAGVEIQLLAQGGPPVADARSRADDRRPGVVRRLTCSASGRTPPCAAAGASSS